jgi:hypothetical protein
MHTITHRESIEEVEAIAGPGSARWARPPTAPEFFQPAARDDARAAFDLPLHRPAIVVSGGGWGIGDLVGAVEVALEVPDSIVLCLSGHNEHAWRRLRERYGANPRVQLLGFTDRMADLLGAADALIHSTAGLTVLEAQIRGCPTISYGFAVGHIRVNNDAYERFGLASVARSKSELSACLREALASRPDPDEAFAKLPSPATIALEARPRIRPFPTVRLRAARLATTGAVAAAIVGGALLTDLGYPLMARALGVGTMRSAPAAGREVGILVDAPAASAGKFARSLKRRDITASFALDSAPRSKELEDLFAAGDEALPRIDNGGVFHSFGTGGRLAAAASSMGLKRPFYYEPPNDGRTGLQALLARSAGGHPVGGAVHLDGPADGVAIRPGDFVELDLTGNGRPGAAISALDSDLGAAGLQGVRLTQLVTP